MKHDGTLVTWGKLAGLRSLEESWENDLERNLAQIIKELGFDRFLMVFVSCESFLSHSSCVVLQCLTFCHTCLEYLNLANLALAMPSFPFNNPTILGSHSAYLPITRQVLYHQPCHTTAVSS